MNPARIIQKKRDGEVLAGDEIKSLVCGFTAGTVPDYQMAAFAMAVFFRGMTAEETAHLTLALLESGETLDWSGVDGVRVDKHSSGGQGDKVSLALAPALACCGVQVPMVAGRGLGPTGGTIDKLESIPGFRTSLRVDEVRRQCEAIGCSISSQSEELVPADRRLYALRDVTATVASVPLITASILSKKLAERLDALVLDVKWGSGAFMRSTEDARHLARSMVAVGNRMNVRTSALITDMNQPLGRAVGNGVEVHETLEILTGAGPVDLRQLIADLGAELLTLAGVAADLDDGRARISRALDSGEAREKYDEMVIAQGGDPTAPIPVAPTQTFTATSSGFVAAIDGERLGYAVIALGGGRRTLDDRLDPSVGLRMRARLGDRVDKGDPLLDLLATDRGLDEARQLVSGAVTISQEPPVVSELVAASVVAADVAP